MMEQIWTLKKSSLSSQPWAKIDFTCPCRHWPATLSDRKVDKVLLANGITSETMTDLKLGESQKSGGLDDDFRTLVFRRIFQRAYSRLQTRYEILFWRIPKLIRILTPSWRFSSPSKQSEVRPKGKINEYTNQLLPCTT